MVSTLTTLVFTAGTWAATVFFAADGDERKPAPRREPTAREDFRRDEAKRDEPRREEPRPDGDRRSMPPGRGPGPDGRPGFGGGPRPPFDPERMKEFQERMEKFRREMAERGFQKPTDGRPWASRAEAEHRRPEPQSEARRCPECEKLAARLHTEHHGHHARPQVPPQAGPSHHGPSHHGPAHHGPHGDGPRPGGPQSLEEISRKLDRLTAAVEELARSLKK